MCGITGFWQQKNQAASVLEQQALQMNNVMLHRGPDDGGVWVDEACGAVVCNRRLAIQDISPLGHMPMLSACERFVLTQNGEVYNFKEIRQDLETEGVRFRSQSDTEVIVEGCVRWGVEATVNRCNGMFAMAIWDRKQRKLYLVRDRLGIKPLYYGHHNGTFLFGSELKALAEHEDFQAEIDRDSLALMLRYCYVPSPRSIYKDIYKLPAGHILTLDQAGGEPTISAFWSAHDVVNESKTNVFEGSPDEAVDELDKLIRDAVRLRMIADVPLGAFLSGGVDSSMVTALMQEQSGQPVKTFSIGFHEDAYNEAVHAKAVAEHLGTDHTELYVSAEQAQAVIPNLAAMYDEPFADASQIPTFLVSELARKHVTVSLSGDGGDELFAGYNRHRLKSMNGIPSPLRKLGAAGLESLSPAAWDKLFASIEKVLPAKLRMRLPGEKLHKVASVMKQSSPQAVYQTLVSTWQSPEDVVLNAHESQIQPLNGFASGNFSDAEMMMFLDLVTYLPDDILTKVDRASMAVSLEARVPLLDHRVVAHAWQLPMALKRHPDQSKWALRQVLYRYVPKDLIERPKMGFGIPIADWLRGSLRDWAEALLSEERLNREGYFNPKPIRQKWEEHLSGRRNWQYPLWNVLMFQAWKERWL